MRGIHPKQARIYLRAGTLTGLIASVLVAFPTGDQQAKMVGSHQPVTFAAMEGKFVGGDRAGVEVIGQPNVSCGGSTIPSRYPVHSAFSLTATFQSYVHGLDEFPEDAWPDNIELLYYSFHLMITLGTLFIVLMALRECSVFARSAGIQQVAALGADAGVSISLHRQHAGMDDGGIGPATLADLRALSHPDGYSKVVSNGDTVFTLIGFFGLYFVLGLLFLFLVGREISHGPDGEPSSGLERSRPV